LVFVVIPLGVVAVVSALVLAGGDRSRPSRRYRPGRPYDFQPVWFLASPERVGPSPSDPELGGPEQHGSRALEQRVQPAADVDVIEDSSGARVLPGRTGGASDRW
jgi:hypothetical protein